MAMTKSSKAKTPPDSPNLYYWWLINECINLQFTISPEILITCEVKLFEYKLRSYRMEGLGQHITLQAVQ